MYLANPWDPCKLYNLQSVDRLDSVKVIIHHISSTQPTLGGSGSLGHYRTGGWPPSRKRTGLGARV